MNKKECVSCHKPARLVNKQNKSIPLPDDKLCPTCYQRAYGRYHSKQRNKKNRERIKFIKKLKPQELIKLVTKMPSPDKCKYHTYRRVYKNSDKVFYRCGYCGIETTKKRTNCSKVSQWKKRYCTY